MKVSPAVTHIEMLQNAESDKFPFVCPVIDVSVTENEIYWKMCGNNLFD